MITEDERVFYEVSEETSEFTIIIMEGRDQYSVYDQFYFEMNTDVSIHSRSIYSSLDFLGDIGGLSDALQ